MGPGPIGLAVLVRVVEQDDLVIAGKVPGIVRRMLVKADQFTVRGIYIGLARGVKAVARRPCPGVPGRRIARPDDDGVGFGVIAGRLPGRAAAMFPGLDLAAVFLVGPAGRGGIAGRGAVLAADAADMALDKGAHPDFLAGIDIAGIKLADHAEFIARAAMDQHDAAGFLVLDDGRGAGHRVADLVIAEFLAPDDLAGLAVQRIDAGIQRAEEHLVAIDRGAAVDHVAAGADIVGQARLEFPQPFAGARIQRPHAAVRAGDIDHPVADQRLGFLAALLFIAKGKRPGRTQQADRIGIDLIQLGPALRAVAHAVHQHILGGVLVVEDILPGDILGAGGAKAASDHQRQRADRRHYVKLASHFLLLCRNLGVVHLGLSGQVLPPIGVRASVS